MTLIAGRDAATTTLPGHPLEPLAPEELSAASALLRADDRFPPDARFVFLELAEPPKDVVATWTAGTAWDRQAAAVLRSPGLRATYEATVSLSSGEVLAWRHVEGVQPPMTAEEFMACEDVVRADPGWQAAMRDRGVTTSRW